MPSTIICIQSVQLDYEARASEIERYFEFLNLLDSGQVEVSTLMALGQVDENALFKTLKANCFLLLYNLMEAVTKNAIQSIYDHMRSEGTSYDLCCDQIKKVVLKNIKSEKLGIETAHRRLSDVVRHIVTETFLVESLLSGSVDASSLKDLARTYGVSQKLHSRHSDGKRLVDVKSKRNALAHGSLTFNDVGKDFPLSELEDIKKNVLIYMQQFIINVDIFLSRRLYLANP